MVRFLGLARVWFKKTAHWEEASTLCIPMNSGYLTREPRWVISADCSKPMRDQVCRMPLEASFRWFAEGERQCGVVCGTVQEQVGKTGDCIGG